MIKHLLSILLLSSLLAHSQVELPPAVANDRNWLSSVGYDFSGATVSKGVSFFNVLGKATQQQSWDVLTGRVWASEVRYDYFNRPVLQTLSSPINSTATFGYRPDFIRSGSLAVGIGQYDTAATLFSPPTISADANTLGWYYSNSNTLDPYQDVTQYPYSRTVYSELNPGEGRATLGGNKINGQWLQGYSFSMAMEQNQFTANDRPELAGKKVIKTISRGVDGIESVVFTDTDGKTLAAARSGNEDSSSLVIRSVYSDILDKGYVDIHIPVGCGGNVNIALNINLHQIRIFNLVTETLLTSASSPSYTTNATSVNLTPGFYRFEDVKNYYGSKAAGDSTPAVRISYTVNYYDYSTNEYDYADRLTVSSQPLSGSSGPLQSTFQYNMLGQLIATTSPDEGTAQFKYRKDGQIRFSQNSEQAKINAFSYTNYDNLGRPVESGVYKGTQMLFSNAGTIVDQPDGLPGSDRSEQNFSLYDIPDPELVDIMAECGLPYQEYRQTFVSGNVSSTHTENPNTTKTWYSYDVYGRVKWVVQQIPGMTCLKTIDYTYNPVNGQLVNVDYQRHNATERFVHKYDFNIAGKLIDVFTSLDNSTFTRQAHYIYNESGALARTELADDLQGIDYVYNLNGQLKAINHPSILPNLDPGSDGTAGSGFAADVFGMAIDYYTGDYTRTGTPKPVTTTTAGVDQYNGNIKATRWNTQVPNAIHSAYTYNYNKNNWLTQATFGSSDNNAAITNNPNADYRVSAISYDANGNIKTLNRKGYTDAGGSNQMDNFTYRYSSAQPNRLLSVKDTEDNADAFRYNDLKNQDLTVPTGGTLSGNPITANLDNYVYNDLGQMTANLQDNVSYEYNASGLVTQINKFTAQLPYEFKSIYFNDYSHFTSASHGWTRAGSPGTQIFTLGFLGNTEQCTDTTLADLYTEALLIKNRLTAKKQFRLLPNTLHRLKFDLILDKMTHGGFQPGGGIDDPDTGSPITPSVTVRLVRPDGSLFATQTITAGAIEYCSRYVDEHLSFDFTTTTEQYLNLELVIGTTTTGTIAGDQYTYVDNLSLEAATRAVVGFVYNDRGQRVKKMSYQATGDSNTTFYVRDAAGSVMGIYALSSVRTSGGRPEAKLLENTIFGSSRIGVFKRPQGRGFGYELYELTDHLGNVRAVIQKSGTTIAALTNKADYYPFGSIMPNKQITDGNYRYAFQGQEKDGETNMEAFELRLWDGRLGRWLTVDPKHQYASPYLGMGNNPVSRIDPDGGSDCTTCPNNAKAGDIYNDIDGFGEVKFDGENWITSNGEIALDDVVIGANTMTPFDVGVEWLTGNGPRDRNFFAGDTFTEMIKTHDHVKQTEEIIARKLASGEKLSDHHYYSLAGLQGVGKYIKDYSTLLTFGNTGNLAVTYLGSYDLKFSLSNRDVKNRTVMIHFKVQNPSTLQSAVRPPVIGYTDAWKNGPGKWINAIIPKTGPLSETNQTIQWSQAIKY